MTLPLEHLSFATDYFGHDVELVVLFHLKVGFFDLKSVAFDLEAVGPDQNLLLWTWNLLL